MGGCAVTRLPVRRVAGIIAGLVILGGLLLLYDPREVASRLRDVRWAIALPAMAGLTLIHLLQVETWRQLSERMTGLRLSRTGACRSYYAGQALGAVTPANLGADFYRAFTLKNGSGGWDGVVAPIVGQRAISAIALVVLAGASLAVKTTASLDFSPTHSVIGLALIGSCLVAYRYRPSLTGLRTRLPASLRVLADFDARGFALPFLLATLFHAGSVLLAYTLVLAVHADAPLFATVQLLLIARLTTLLPITPYGLGFQEASLALLLPGVGLSEAGALAVSVLNRLAMLVTAGVGISALLAGQSDRIPVTKLDPVRDTAST
jgi:uncharacterized membrane protein YbhN (UPF0104 family)